MTQSWIALFRSVEYSYFCLWGFDSYVPATSVSPRQIMISQKKHCKGRRAWLVSFPWSINTGGKGDEAYLLFLAGVPVREQLVDGYKRCHFLLSIAGKKLLSRLEFSPIFIYIFPLCYQHFWAFGDERSLWYHTLLVNCGNPFVILSVGQKIGISNEIAQMTDTEFSGSIFPPRAAQNSLIRQRLEQRLKPTLFTVPY